MAQMSLCIHTVSPGLSLLTKQTMEVDEGSDIYLACTFKGLGAQWLSGRVLDSRPKGRGFEPHRRICVVVLEQDTFILA